MFDCKNTLEAVPAYSDDELEKIDQIQNMFIDKGLAQQQYHDCFSKTGITDADAPLILGSDELEELYNDRDREYQQRLDSGADPAELYDELGEF